MAPLWHLTMWRPLTPHAPLYGTSLYRDPLALVPGNCMEPYGTGRTPPPPPLLWTVGLKECNAAVGTPLEVMQEDCDSSSVVI